MSRFIQPLIPYFKKFAVYMGLNPEVASKNWPVRGTYRVAPASAPAPVYTANFPLKQDHISDLHWVDKEVKLHKSAMEVPFKWAHSNPRKDMRNMWNRATLRTPRVANQIIPQGPNAVRWRQVSEVEESSL